MSMNEILKRHEAGAKQAGMSVGGQFAASMQTEASGETLRSVLPPNEPNGAQNGDMSHEGSFCFPPITQTAEEHIAFFEQAEIPEITLSNVQFAHEDYIRRTADERARKQFHEYENTPEYREWEKTFVGLGSDYFQRAANERLNKMRAAHEEVIREHVELRPSDIRPIARYGQMFYRSGHLSAAETKKIDEHVVEINGEKTTLNALAGKYKFHNWIADAITTNDLRAARSTERLWQLMNDRL
ncbi:hypothetical protein ACXR2T_10255 [Leucobacter sp. HY1910]